MKIYVRIETKCEPRARPLFVLLRHLKFFHASEISRLCKNGRVEKNHWYSLIMKPTQTHTNTHKP